jgi:hypothetical protein
MKRLVMMTALLCGLLLLWACGSKTTAPTTTNKTASTSEGPPTGASSKSWTAVQIDAFLATKPSSSQPSPLHGQGAMFELYGQKYSVDPRLVVAISAAETSYGTGKCRSTPVINTRNAWNWFWCESNDSCGSDVCVGSTFDTWGSGIDTVSHFMRSTYINKGYYNVKLIASKYCTVGCENWVPNVTTVMQEMGGDPENLALSAGN